MPDVTIVLTDQEQSALNQIFDVALRARGMEALDVVAHFKAKIGGASSQEPPASPVSEEDEQTIESRN